ncbi:hypothetical protein F4808DRAFT_311830 [Astrocystis sublimbata]|nr:hypothetical protein F4808DRAFT_311830 [Astrocystis sublimbata]
MHSVGPTFGRGQAGQADSLAVLGTGHRHKRTRSTGETGHRTGTCMDDGTFRLQPTMQSNDAHHGNGTLVQARRASSPGTASSAPQPLLVSGSRGGLWLTGSTGIRARLFCSHLRITASRMGFRVSGWRITDPFFSTGRSDIDPHSIRLGKGLVPGGNILARLATGCATLFDRNPVAVYNFDNCAPKCSKSRTEVIVCVCLVCVCVPAWSATGLAQRHHFT